jgi:hypothetical protein
LLFVLHFLKSNSLQEHHAAVYEMTQPQCHLWIHMLFGRVYDKLHFLGERVNFV